MSSKRVTRSQQSSASTQSVHEATSATTTSQPTPSNGLKKLSHTARRKSIHVKENETEVVGGFRFTRINKKRESPPTSSESISQKVAVAPPADPNSAPTTTVSGETRATTTTRQGNSRRTHGAVPAEVERTHSTNPEFRHASEEYFTQVPYKMQPESDVMARSQSPTALCVETLRSNQTLDTMDSKLQALSIASVGGGPRHIVHPDDRPLPTTSAKGYPIIPDPKATFALPGFPASEQHEGESVSRELSPDIPCQLSSLKFETTNMPLKEEVPQKKMRSKRRRDSLAARGKRLSLSAISEADPPHQLVQVSEFHKHISMDLDSEKRMRQIILWTLSRFIETSIGHSASDLALKEDLERLIRQILDDELQISWLDRELEPSDYETTSHTAKMSAEWTQWKAFHDRLLREEHQWLELKEKFKAPAETIADESESSLLDLLSAADSAFIEKDCGISLDFLRHEDEQLPLEPISKEISAIAALAENQIPYISGALSSAQSLVEIAEQYRQRVVHDLVKVIKLYEDVTEQCGDIASHCVKLNSSLPDDPLELIQQLCDMSA